MQRLPKGRSIGSFGCVEDDVRNRLCGRPAPFTLRRAARCVSLREDKCDVRVDIEKVTRG